MAITLPTVLVYANSMKPSESVLLVYQAWVCEAFGIV